MLQRIDLVLRPALGEAVAEDAAVMRHVAVEIGGALPKADRGEMPGLKRRALPLVLGIIGDAVQADLAVRPRLYAGPFGALRKVEGLRAGPGVDPPRRMARAPAVAPAPGIAARPPFLGVDPL